MRLLTRCSPKYFWRATLAPGRYFPVVVPQTGVFFVRRSCPYGEISHAAVAARRFCSKNVGDEHDRAKPLVNIYYPKRVCALRMPTVSDRRITVDSLSREGFHKVSCVQCTSNINHISDSVQCLREIDCFSLAPLCRVECLCTTVCKGDENDNSWQHRCSRFCRASITREPNGAQRYDLLLCDI